MRTPQVIVGAGLVVLMVLLALPQRRLATYNPGTETTVTGTVQEVQNFYCPITGAVGTHILLANEKGAVMVHVAPAGYLRGNNWNFHEGDRVEVIGSKMRFAGHDAIVARAVERDSVTLSFRNHDGKPLWIE